MLRPLSIFIGTCYTRVRRRSHLISSILLTSMIGLALDVLVMIVMFSAINNSDRETRTRILGMVSRATVEPYQPIDDWHALAERVKAHEHVTTVAPFTRVRGILSANGAVQTMMVDTADPLEEVKISIIPDFFRQSSLAELKVSGFDTVIGQPVMQKLGVGIGDKVTLTLPEVAITPAGVFPRTERFTVIGTFRIDAGELNGGPSLIRLEDAARLQRWKTDQVQGLHLKLGDLFQAPQVVWEIARTLTDNDLYARGWTCSHGNLYQAIRMEKIMIGLLLLLIVAIATFNITSTLVMVVTDKKSNIAILHTLGATPGQIMATFMAQGTVIGVAGTLVSGVLGMAAALNVSARIPALEELLDHQFLTPDAYFIDYLPPQPMLDDVMLVYDTALVLSFLATLYPAWRVARTQSVGTLCYE